MKFAGLFLGLSLFLLLPIIHNPIFAWTGIDVMNICAPLGSYRLDSCSANPPPEPYVECSRTIPRDPGDPDRVYNQCGCPGVFSSTPYNHTVFVEQYDFTCSDGYNTSAYTCTDLGVKPGECGNPLPACSCDNNASICVGETYPASGEGCTTVLCTGTKQPSCPAASTVQCGQNITSTNSCGSCGKGTQCATGSSCNGTQCVGNCTQGGVARQEKKCQGQQECTVNIHTTSTCSEYEGTPYNCQLVPGKCGYQAPAANCSCGGLGQDTCDGSTSERNAYQCGNRDGSLCLPGLERDSNNKCNNPPGSTSCLPNGTSCTSDPSCCGGDCWGGGGFICRTDPGPGGICQNGTDYECKFNDQSCGDAQVGETNSNPDLSGPSYCICQLDAGAKVWRGVPQCCTGSCPANGSSVACGTPVTNGCGTSCNIGSGTYCAGIAACVSGSCQVAPDAPLPVCHSTGSGRTDDLCNGESTQSLNTINLSAKNIGLANSGEPHLHVYQISRFNDFDPNLTVETPRLYSNNINEVFSAAVDDIFAQYGGGQALETGQFYFWRTKAYSPATGFESPWSESWTFRYAPLPPHIETVGGDVHSNQ